MSEYIGSSGEERSRDFEISILDKEILQDWVKQLPQNHVVGMLLSGDRLSCCDEGVGLVVGGRVVSVATIAPEGEQSSGQPTIVALYTLPEHRGKGYGEETFKAAITRCRERGFPKVRVDVMSQKVQRMIERLPEEDRGYLVLYDLGPIMDIFPG